MKLATWNVEKAYPKRREGLLREIHAQNANVWVFTEMHDDFATGFTHSHSSQGGLDGDGKFGEEYRWVTLASEFPMTPLNTSDNQRAAAARLLPAGEAPFIVYGTVLPWPTDTWRGFSRKNAEAFSKALETQQQDWIQLRRDYPHDELFVMGDFNQALVASKYQGTKQKRGILESVLSQAKFVALTGGDNDPVHRHSPDWASIDRICSRIDSAWSTTAIERWPNSDAPDRSLSDHFGICVTLDKPHGAPNFG